MTLTYDWKTYSLQTTNLLKPLLGNVTNYILNRKILFDFLDKHVIENNILLLCDVGTWTPQGQFIQQIPSHQLDDLRYHHPQYTSVTTYHQPASGNTCVIRPLKKLMYEDNIVTAVYKFVFSCRLPTTAARYIYPDKR